MEDRSNLTEEKGKKLWQFVSPEEHCLPQTAATEKAKSALVGIWHQLFKEEEKKEAVDVQAELRSVPQALLDWVAPYPTWTTAANEVYQTLKPWARDERPKEFFKIIIGPPGAGVKEILLKLAEQEGWPVLDVPDYKTILEGDYSWIDGFTKSNEAPLVIPQLEKVFLRHFNGLESLRKLLDKLFHQRQRFVIGCNSWLWKYLEMSMEVENCFPNPLVLQSLDSEALEKWFCLLEKANGKYTTVFRQSDNGNYVLPVRETADDPIDDELLEEDADETEPADFLKKLAVASRGIPLVSWSVWRHCLNLAPEEEVEDTARDAAILDKGHTIWVRPFDKVSFPKVPPGMGQKACFILQSLLMHDGLPPDVLIELLNFDRDDLLSIIKRLSKAGLILEERGLWRVTWLGYPGVRKFLQAEDYLVDAL